MCVFIVNNKVLCTHPYHNFYLHQRCVLLNDVNKALVHGWHVAAVQVDGLKRGCGFGQVYWHKRCSLAKSKHAVKGTLLLDNLIKQRDGVVCPIRVSRDVHLAARRILYPQAIVSVRHDKSKVAA